MRLYNVKGKHALPYNSYQEAYLEYVALTEYEYMYFWGKYYVGVGVKMRIYIKYLF